MRHVINTLIFGTVFLGLALASVAQVAAIEPNLHDHDAEAEIKSSVSSALEWLAKHQLPDGSWSFEHRSGVCDGRCPNQGSLAKATNAATAMALLPFLGAGETHKEGKHKRLIGRGLSFLMENAKKGEDTASFMEPGGTMYSQGLSTIVLCEAYGRSGDRDLLDITQSALNFIVEAQDPVGGGWRYVPRQPGDTSVSGWQMSAIHSGQLASLVVPSRTTLRARHFLDAVQSDGGAKYGYTKSGAGAATTSIGLLLRIRFGSGRDNEAIARGLQFIQNQGPSERNMYYNYYASQLMFHCGGKPWREWRKKMHAFLVEEQEHEGHKAGSWYVPGDHGTERGGRLYCTSLAAMTLEIDYRHLAIHQPSKKQRAK